MTIFYCLRFETPPNLDGQVPVFISPSVQVITPRYWVPFSSSPTTRRATVEIFQPDSTRVSVTFFLSFSLAVSS
jgi:hypothetical protein